MQLDFEGEPLLPDDIETPQSFHLWWRDVVRDGWDSAQVLEALQSRPGDISLARQCLVAYRGSSDDVYFPLLELCWASSDIRVQLYAKSLELFPKLARDDSPVFIRETLPGLAGDIEALERADGSLFAREVACSLHLALAIGLHHEERYTESMKHASRGDYLAKRLNAPFCRVRAKSVCVSVFGATGDVVDALHSLRDMDLADGIPGSTHIEYLNRAEAAFASQLGNLDNALMLLERSFLQGEAFDQRMSEHAQRLSAGEHQRIRLRWAVGGEAEELLIPDDSSALEGKVSSSLQSILRARATLPYGSGAKTRKALLLEALKPWTHPRQPMSFLWGRSVGCWIQGLIHLELGNVEQAKEYALGVSYPTRQALDLRLDEAGLWLDLFLDPRSSAKPDAIREWLDKLRAVFVDAREEPLASAEGLAYKLLFWHPKVAAFAASAPGGIRELTPAIESILRCGVTNGVYEIDLPATLAVEWALRALGYDENPNVKLESADVGGAGKRRSDLLGKRREYRFVRPVVSPVPIIYGLALLGQMEHAQKVYMRYGVMPRLRANTQYSMISLLENVDVCVQAMLTGHLPVHNFALELSSGNPVLGDIDRYPSMGTREKATRRFEA